MFTIDKKEYDESEHYSKVLQDNLPKEDKK
jgi:hypothetical protein